MYDDDSTEFDAYWEMIEEAEGAEADANFDRAFIAFVGVLLMVMFALCAFAMIAYPVTR